MTGSYEKFLTGQKFCTCEDPDIIKRICFHRNYVSVNSFQEFRVDIHYCKKCGKAPKTTT